jgi:hypothetical protein
MDITTSTFHMGMVSKDKENNNEHKVHGEFV